MEWARAIRDYRSIHKLTQEEFAASVGVEPRSVRRWETGDSVPGRAKIRQLAEILTPFLTTRQMVEDLVQLCAGMAMIVTPDQTIVSISLAAQADLRTCGLEGAPGRTCLSLPEDILADHLTAIHNDSVTRFTSEYIAHWPTHSEHVRSDIRVMRMFKIPMAIDIYETMPVASSAHMNHRQQTI